MRRTLTERRKLQRETKTVTTPHGEVTVKLGKLNGEIVQVRWISKLPCYCGKG